MSHSYCTATDLSGSVTNMSSPTKPIWQEANERVREFTAPVIAVQERMAVLCGIVNAAEAELTSLIAESVADGLWVQPEVMTLEHWISWQCGMAPARAHQFAAAAKRVDELPETMARYRVGALSSDQVAAIVRLAPPVKDAEVAAFAEQATVAQLRRTLAKYHWGPDKPEPTRQEKRSLSFGTTEQGTWRINAEVPADEGARIEAALTAMRKELIGAAGDKEGRAEVSWADALLGLIDRAVENDDAKVLGRRKRSLVHLHLEIGLDGQWVGTVHMGTVLNQALRRLQTCDCAVEPIYEQLGLPVSVGRTQYTVPDRTRIIVERRDNGCRIPGCSARHTEVHHIIHWEDDGPTSTWNLVCLCPRHHRLHHLGLLGISGNADDPNGLTLTDKWGRAIEDSGRPAPPGAPPGDAATQAELPWQRYTHATGELVRNQDIWFGPPVTQPAA